MSNLKGNFTVNLRFPEILLPLFTLLVLIIIIKLFSFSSPGANEDEYYQAEFNKHYKIFTLNIPDELTFAGEEVPIGKIDVREKLDRELLVNTYWQSQSLLFLKRANRWFPVIEPILKEQGVPEDFKYLSLIESGFTNVVSPAGATGYWQLMKSAGMEHGLEVNDYVDERYHVEKSTLAACKYLKEAREKFGSWTLAAASYNMGRAGLNRQLKKQKVNNYYDLLLNEETSRYLYRIIAVKQIISTPFKYGFYYRDKDLYAPLNDVRIAKVDTSIKDLAEFAIEQKITYKVLKYFNPWLRRNELPNRTNTLYEIKIPSEELANKLIVELPKLEEEENQEKK